MTNSSNCAGSGSGHVSQVGGYASSELASARNGAPKPTQGFHSGRAPSATAVRSAARCEYQ